MDANANNKLDEKSSGKRLANFSGGGDDFMSMSATSKDKVQTITSKDIRNFNDEFLKSKGMKQPEQVNKDTGETKPRRAPGAPSPDKNEQAKRKKNKKKNKDNKKSNIPTY